MTALAQVDVSLTLIVSPVIRAQDYIALGLLMALDTAWVPRINLVFVLENVENVLEAVVFEVSADGYRWVSLGLPSWFLRRS